VATAAEDSADFELRLRRVYELTLPDVFGYLLARCAGDRSLAEDLCSETYLAAVGRVRRDGPEALTLPWLKVVAHNKWVDHWRRRARIDRSAQQLRLVAPVDSGDDEDRIAGRSDLQRGLSSLSPEHRVALVLRYMDGLPVADVAATLDRSLVATESLLARARRALGVALEGTKR
jgi:RNA polymerase sigma-70 factor (ECF subfamily)